MKNKTPLSDSQSGMQIDWFTVIVIVVVLLLHTFIPHDSCQ